jgi:type VI secretion system protein ImpD
MLCVSRFAHYIKVIVRDRLGRFETPQDIEDQLSAWLLNYVTGNEDGGDDIKARYPLRAGQVQVRDTPGSPGAYRCIIHLQPHFHMDHVVSSFRLVTELNRSGAAR